MVLNESYFQLAVEKIVGLKCQLSIKRDCDLTKKQQQKNTWVNINDVMLTQQ